MYYIGIDGGGTKTCFVLADSSLNILNTIYDKSCNYLDVGISNVVSLISSGIERLIKDHCLKSEITSCFIAVAGFGDIKSDEKVIIDCLKPVFDGILYSVGNDTLNGLYGSLNGQDGINIIAGTGSIGLGSYKGEFYRSGGWHPIINSDEGSGYWLSRNLLNHFSRQADNREPKTLLYDFLRTKYVLKDDYDILSLLLDSDKYNQNRAKIASFSYDLYELAKLGDKIAIDLYKQAANEFKDIIFAIKNKLGFFEQEIVNVSYSGGVFNAKEFVLPHLSVLLGPGFKLVNPVFDPTIGALLLAYRQVNENISDELINNLKRQTKIEI